jgi:ATP-binding cassette subfamily B protein
MHNLSSRIARSVQGLIGRPVDSRQEGPGYMAVARVNPSRYFRSELGRLVRLGFCSLLSAYCQLMAVVLIVPLAQTIAKGDKRFEHKLGLFKLSATPTALALLAAGAIVTAGLLDTWIAWARATMMARWELARREEIIVEYMSADYPTQASERLGTLATLLGYAAAGSNALGATVSALDSSLTILIFTIGAIFVDYRAALLLIVTVTSLSLVLRPLMNRTKRYSKLLSQNTIAYGREVTETTRMARDVRVFWAITPIAKRMTSVSRRLAKLRQRAAFINGITSPAYQYLGMLLVVVALAAVQGVHGVDLAKFGSIALILLRSMSFGQQLQGSYQNILANMPYVEQLESARAVYQSHATPDGSVGLEAVHELELKNVSYSYDGETDALSDVSVSFRRGEIVGVVGPSGSGKSTLSQLILRLREPTGGQIVVNRTPVGEYTLASWYRHVSLVPQDPRLLHATVSENIAFLDDTIGREQVVAAAQAANVHDVIGELEKGYDTLIGPAFRDLSGGQIQRIGIARALARGAQVLVLDEPTSALDVHSEAVIQTTLEGLRGSAMVLIIAHRLSTLSICDRILVLHEGRVETLGALSEVSHRSDFFRRALDAGTLEVGGADNPATGSDEA